MLRLLLVLLLTPCAALAAQGRDTAAVGTVRALYRAFAWEAGQRPSAPGQLTLVEQPKRELKRYFDAQLVTLLLADRACVMRSESICRLAFSPLWDAQDPVAEDLAIGPGATAGEVLVSFRVPADSSRTRLRYWLTSTPAGWRIRDIEYSHHASLRRLLEGRP